MQVYVVFNVYLLLISFTFQPAGLEPIKYVALFKLKVKMSEILPFFLFHTLELFAKIFWKFQGEHYKKT